MNLLLLEFLPDVLQVVKISTALGFISSTFSWTKDSQCNIFRHIMEYQSVQTNAVTKLLVNVGSYGNQLTFQDN